MATGASIDVKKTRLIGKTGIYAASLGLDAFNTPAADCGISIRIDKYGSFISLRVGAFGEFTIVANEEGEGMKLDTINDSPAGDSIEEVYERLSEALYL